MIENINCAACHSADKPLEDFICEIEDDTSHHRMKTQEIKCGFGLQGTCCTLCANGPCRITAQAPKGVCGADADTIVARNFLRRVTGGTASYLHVLENAVWNLKKTGEKQGKIKGEDTLNNLADTLDITIDNKHEKAIALADLILKDLYKPQFEPMEIIDKIAYEPRLKVWNKLGLKPGGGKSEVFDALVKTSTNLNSDPINMVLHSLKLGVATGFYGLILTNLVNDILLGEPKIRIDKVGFNVLNMDYINIMVTGHQQSLLADLQDTLISPASMSIANSVGAKGFKIVGSTCVGQDIQLRGEHYQEVFAGHVGNNFTTEPLLATGAIDLVVSEFNCTLPGLEPIARDKEVKLICIDEVAKKSSADLIPYSYENKRQVTNKIIEEAVISYRKRRKTIALNLPKNHGNDNTITGVSENSLKDFFGGSYEPLLNLIKSGDIKGIAGVVGCSNLISGGHDVFTVGLTKELIKKDILVLSAGCSSGGLQNAGLMSPEAASLAGSSLESICRQYGLPPVLNFGPCLAIGRLEMVATELARDLGIDLPQLPLIMSAPQWLEEQAVADGAFSLALGLPLHLASPPFITGSKVVTDVLTSGVTKLTGGQLIINDDIVESADLLEDIIIEKRKDLGI